MNRSKMENANRSASAGFLILIASVLMISCTRETNLPEFDPLPNIDPRNFNTKIKSSVSEVENSYENDSPLSIVVINLSDQPVFFSNDFGPKIYTVKADKWVEVQNNYLRKTNPGKLPPNKDVRIGFVAKVQPLLPDLLNPQSIRVLVIGYLENNKSQPVGAFIDVTIHP